MGTSKLFLAIAALLYVAFAAKKKKYQVKIQFLVVIAVLFASVTCWRISDSIPSRTDLISVTALGEKSEAALADEVFITGFTVDGNSYPVGKIEEGKWFWAGDMYAWRNEADLRQPEGTTRKVTLHVPVGEQRLIHFRPGEWSGYAEVSTNNGTQFVDTSTVDSLEIGGSRFRERAASFGTEILVYTLLLGTLVFLIQRCAAKYASDPKQADIWLEENSGKLTYGLIALCAGILMYSYCGRESFWSDEIATMEDIMGSLRWVFYRCATLTEATPPLFFVLARLWYKIVPYGQENLLLFSILCTVGAVYLTGTAAEEIRGKACGILSALMMAFSTTVWGCFANEFRAYALTLLFMAGSLLFYVKRNQFPEQKRWCVLFSFAMTCLAMTFYFGVFACAAYFFADMYLASQRKIKWWRIIDYILPGAVFLSWMIVVYLVSLSKNQIAGDVTWQPIPGVIDVRELVSFLTGYTTWQYNLFWAGLACGVVTFLSGIKQKRDFSYKAFYRSFFALTIIGTVALLVIWGNFISRTYTMWYPRYFVCLFPLVVILSGWVICDFGDLLGDRGSFAIQACTGVIACVMFFNAVPQMSSLTSSQPFREGADWLYQQYNTIYNEDTIVIAASKYSRGWEYFLYQNGRRDPINMFPDKECTGEMLSDYNRIYVQYSHGGLNASIQEVLARDFSFVAVYENAHIWEYVRNS